MTEALLTLNIYTYPAAFALLFAAGIRLFLNTRHWTLAIFSMGMGTVLVSQAIVIGAYQLFPVVYEHDVGVVSHQIRENLFWVSIGLNACGLAVGSFAITFYAYKTAVRGNVA